MDNQEFDEILEHRLQHARAVLGTKAGEYASEGDRLHNFKQAAHLEETNMRGALKGMMAKHTVSIYDMLKAENLASDAQWEEKIGDHINYLILLSAVVAEERKEHTAVNAEARYGVDRADILTDIGPTDLKFPIRGAGRTEDKHLTFYTYADMDAWLARHDHIVTDFEAFDPRDPFYADTMPAFILRLTDQEPRFYRKVTH